MDVDAAIACTSKKLQISFVVDSGGCCEVDGDDNDLKRCSGVTDDFVYVICTEN